MERGERRAPSKAGACTGIPVRTRAARTARNALQTVRWLHWLYLHTARLRVCRHLPVAQGGLMAVTAGIMLHALAGAIGGVPHGVPCQKGDPVGPRAGLMHPAPVCAPDSCASSTGVQCSTAECSEPLRAAFDSCCPSVIVPPRSDGSRYYPPSDFQYSDLLGFDGAGAILPTVWEDTWTVQLKTSDPLAAVERAPSQPGLRIGSQIASNWSGPQVRVTKGDGLPSFSLTNATGHVLKIPALWLVGGNPSFYFPSQPNKLYGPIALERFSREAKAADTIGVRIVSYTLSFVGDNYVVSHPEILPDGTLGPGVLAFLKTQLLALPDSMIILRFRLDHTFSKSTGHVKLQSVLNDTDIISSWTASPTQKWAAQMGQLIAKVMTTVDAAFPGRLLGAQTLHGCTCKS